jgi:DNA-binding CsgD family transcriptional regulator
MFMSPVNRKNPKGDNASAYKKKEKVMNRPEELSQPLDVLPDRLPDMVPTVIRRRLSLLGKPLTKTELQILRWASEGKTIWEMSKIRCTSEATVKFHLRNIYGKLDVNNRVQAMNEAARQGLC